MAVSIPKPAKCEVRALIRFSYAKEGTAADIHRQFVSVYGKDVITRQNMGKYVEILKREEIMFMIK
jgi:hypothetical protein